MLKASLPETAEKNSRQVREEKTGEEETKENQSAVRVGRRQISTKRERHGSQRKADKESGKR